MAIEWMENFQNYGTGNTGLANMLDGMWASMLNTTTYNGLYDDPDGVSSGKVFRFDDGGSSGEATRLRRVLPSGTQTTVGVAQRVWLSELPDSANPHGPSLCVFCDSNNDEQIAIFVNTTGTISAYLGSANGGTLLGTTTVPVIVAAAWNHVETKVVFDNSTSGSVEVRVNGVPKLSLTGIDTQATAVAGCAQVQFGMTNAATVNFMYYLKDVIVWNGTGSSNNDFLGDCQVVTLLPDGDSSLNWDVSTGTTGYDLVDEIIPDDTDYISADATPPAATVFTLSNLDPDVVTVKGLQTVQRSLKTDGGTANVQLSLRSSGSDDAGTDVPITVTATYWFDISELDPNTASAWTPVAVDAALLVVDRTV